MVEIFKLFEPEFPNGLFKGPPGFKEKLPV
jgi:hypothetical protein